MSLSKVYQSNFSVSYALCSILFSTIYLLMILELQHFLRNKLATKVVIENSFFILFMSCDSCEIFPSEKCRSTGEVPSVRGWPREFVSRWRILLHIHKSVDFKLCLNHVEGKKSLWKNTLTKLGYILFLRLVLSFYYLWFWLTLDQF